MLSIALVLCVQADAARVDWSQFRGPDGHAVAVDGAEYPASLELPRDLRWRTALPAGHASVVVHGDRLFVTGVAERNLETLCVERADGTVLWRRAVAAEALEQHHRVNSAASSTPVTDGETVVAYFGSFGLVAYDFEGVERWRRPLPVPDNTFGSASSPVIADGRLLFVHDANAGSFLEALDPATGEVLWRREREGFRSGWSTPVVRRHAEGIDVLVYGVGSLTAYDLADGAERWSVPGLTDEPIVMPAASDELVWLTSYNMKTNTEVIGLPAWETIVGELDRDGSGTLDAGEAEANASVLSRYDADGEGDHPLRIFFRWLDEDRDGELDGEEWTKLEDWVDGFAHVNGVLAVRPGGDDAPAEVVWQYPRGVPECPSPLLVDGLLLLVKNGGLVTCLDATSGELRYQERLEARGPFYASPVAADGKVYVVSARGDLSILRAGADWEPLARVELGERVMATPALQDGVLYVRTESSLLALGRR